MDGKQQEGYTQDQIRDAFCATTDETRDRLRHPAKQDPVTELITGHVEAVTKALAFVTRKIYRHNRPRDPSPPQLRRFMRDEVDAVWYIHEIMDDDVTLIRDLEPRLEESIPSAFKEEWQNVLNEVDTAINASLNIVRTSLDGWDEYTPDERSRARQRSIDTLTELAGYWSAIANKLTVIKNEFSGKGSGSGSPPAAVPEAGAGPSPRSAEG